jgi:hypothetical protein
MNLLPAEEFRGRDFRNARSRHQVRLVVIPGAWRRESPWDGNSNMILIPSLKH